jgi:hypothetical protein
MSCLCRYFYISILYNVCYTLALYGLILFWNGASELLQPFNPLLKFVLVKTVVFLTFWQVGLDSYPARSNQPCVDRPLSTVDDPQYTFAKGSWVLVCCATLLNIPDALLGYPATMHDHDQGLAGLQCRALASLPSIRWARLVTLRMAKPCRTS